MGLCQRSAMHELTYCVNNSKIVYYSIFVLDNTLTSVQHETLGIYIVYSSEMLKPQGSRPKIWPRPRP